MFKKTKIDTPWCLFHPVPSLGELDMTDPQTFLWCPTKSFRERMGYVRVEAASPPAPAAAPPPAAESSEVRGLEGRVGGVVAVFVCILFDVFGVFFGKVVDGIIF